MDLPRASELIALAETQPLPSIEAVHNFVPEYHRIAEAEANWIKEQKKEQGEWFITEKWNEDDVEAIYAIELATFPTPWTLDSFYYELEENQYCTLFSGRRRWENNWILWHVACD